MPPSIETYLALEALTAEMLDLAIQQRFECIDALAPRYQELSDQVSNTTLPSDSAEFAPIIVRILDNQKNLEQQLLPWLSHVRKLLRDDRREQALISAYGKTT